MKNKIVKIKSKEQKTNCIVIPKGEFHSDWFKCISCGCLVEKDTYSDISTCPECGDLMHRIY